MRFDSAVILWRRIRCYWDTLRGSIGNPELDGELDFILLPFYQFCFPSTGETTVGQNDHDIKLSGALVAETHWSVDT